MKKLLVIILICIISNSLYASGELKEVCHNKTDKIGKPVMKDGKIVQVCKKIKIHKKLKGDKVVPSKK